MNEVNNGPLSCTQNTALWQSGIEGSRKRLICSRQHQGLSVSYPALQKRAASIKKALLLVPILWEMSHTHVCFNLYCNIYKKQCPVGILRKMSVVYFDE